MIDSSAGSLQQSPIIYQYELSVEVEDKFKQSMIQTSRSVLGNYILLQTKAKQLLLVEFTGNTI
jgi:hypothetical protein